MIVLPCQEKCISRVLLLLDNTTANFATVLKVGDLGGEQAGITVWAGNDSQELVYVLGIGMYLQERERISKGQIYE